MEVHHHPDLHHKKKKFSEYFLEFLMIFLAVSMGFIAENLREGRSEHAKEKDYMIALVRDLQEDTASLKVNIKNNQWRISGMDTLLYLSGKDISEPANRQLFYKCCRNYMLSDDLFKNRDVTLSQLKSTGSYRLIQKDSAAYKIAAYDQSFSTIYDQGKAYEKSLFDAQDVLFELIDMNVFTNRDYFHRTVPTGKELPPVLNDPQKQKIYFNRVLFVREIIDNYSNNFLRQELDAATDLIRFLQKAYRLDK